MYGQLCVCVCAEAKFLMVSNGHFSEWKENTEYYWKQIRENSENNAIF